MISPKKDPKLFTKLHNKHKAKDYSLYRQILLFIFFLKNNKVLQLPPHTHHRQNPWIKYIYSRIKDISYNKQQEKHTQISQ